MAFPLIARAIGFMVVLPLADCSALRVATKVDSMRVEDLRSAMMEELLNALGNSSKVTEQRLRSIEDTLRPTFLSMPKNEYGNLDSAGVRYVLHRFFVQRHGMFIKGLELTSRSNSSVDQVLEDHVPSYVQDLFEARLNGRGLALQELAVLTATLEHLIQDEAVARLRASYKVAGLSEIKAASEAEAQLLIDAYMLFFIVNMDADIKPKELRKRISSMSKAYPGWPQARVFAQEIRSRFSEDQGLGFEAASKVVEEIGERFGKFQDGECREMKNALVKIEEHGSGRVSLKSFYSQSLAGDFGFSESVEYMRELGVLDESDPGSKHVFIANYVTSHTNCLASSGMYSICCLNECEGLLGHLEREVAAPEASAARIASLVSGLGSATVPAGRTLSRALLDRLEEVAQQNGGQVPLHGRLFAQWLHHAYPRECPYPHQAGTISPVYAAEWLRAGGNLSASREEMDRHIQEAQPRPSSSSPWAAEEELLAPKRTQRRSSPLRWVVGLCAVVSALVALSHSLTQGLKAMAPHGSAELLPYTMKHLKQHQC